MKRRTFLRSSLAGAALMQLNPLYSIEPRLKSFKDGRYAMLSESDLPVIDEVDVIVAGATTAGIAAALKASEMGSKVFVIAYQPYLAEDVCGTYKHLFEPHKSSHPLMKLVFPEGKSPAPFYAKKGLENQLIDRGINFLYSSYVSDVLFDDMWQPAGVIITNRMSRQIILGKVIIDSTHGAYVGKLAGLGFSEAKTGKSHSFSYIAVGNNPEKSFAKKTLPLSPSRDGKSYQAWEYSFEMEVPDFSYSSICRAEQDIREKVWDADQIDSADCISFIPPYKISGQKPYRKSEVDIKHLSPGTFKPQNQNRFFVLGACADLPRIAVSSLLHPLVFIQAGEMVGAAAAEEGKLANKPSNVKLKPLKASGFLKGLTGISSETMRPVHVQKRIHVNASALPILGEYEVVVVGGGTAGANVGIGAARHGAKVLVTEYLHGLGGIGTMGMIGRYWDGYREGFTMEIDNEVDKMGSPGHPQRKKGKNEWPVEWKKEWYRREIGRAGGDIWYGIIGCGAFIENGKLKGVVVTSPEGMGVVLAKIVVDSTGSGDIAVAAGTKYGYTDHASVGVQGAGLPPVGIGDHYNNTDWTFTDDNDIFDITRLFISAKGKYEDFYDVGKLSQTRERRRIEGEHEVSVLDIVNKRRYPDTISFHKSSFDTHGYTVHPFFTIRPPEQRNFSYDADVPLRSLLPKGLDNIIVTGLGASAQRDAMPVIRMQPCLQNQGYSVGYLSALAVKQNRSFREMDIKEVQRYLTGKNILPQRVLTDVDSFPLPQEAFVNAIATLPDNFKGLEVLLTDRNKASVLLQDALKNAQESDKAYYSQVLCMLGFEDGIDYIVKSIRSYDKWDDGWNYTGMHQFGKSMSKLDSLIIALGMVRRKDTLPDVLEKAKMLGPDHFFSHFRAVSLACELIGSEEAAPVLHSLLSMKGITGHHVTTHQQARERTVSNRNDVSFRNNVLREIHLARALYRCGDYKEVGKGILENYASDLHGHYFRHAYGVLKGEA